MLLNILQCPGQPPKTKDSVLQNVSSAYIENSALELNILEFTSQLFSFNGHVTLAKFPDLAEPQISLPLNGHNDKVRTLMAFGQD